MLKVFTDQSLLTAQNRPYIFPILLNLFYKDNTTFRDHYILVDNIQDADITIFPLDINRSEISYKQEQFNEFVENSKLKKLPIWVYTSGDVGKTLDDDSIYTFRLGGFHSKLNERTFILPAHIGFPLEQLPFNIGETKPKSDKPTIGFVGFANTGFSFNLKSKLMHLNSQLSRILGKNKTDQQPYYPASQKRFEYLNILIKDKNITTDFVLRKAYRAGVKTADERLQTSIDFYRNIHSNIYTFCMRGGGNFSVRFYETLALGRIPILINTDCRLPLQDKIDWQKHCVIIEEKDVERLPEILKIFHENASEEQLMNLQRSNRALWKDKLTHKSYFIEIHNIFTQNQKS